MGTEPASSEVKLFSNFQRNSFNPLFIHTQFNSFVIMLYINVDLKFDIFKLLNCSYLNLVSEGFKHNNPLQA